MNIEHVTNKPVVDNMDNLFWSVIEAMGFNQSECPYTPILPSWEHFPIVVAIRCAEKKLNVAYVALPPQLD